MNDAVLSRSLAIAMLLASMSCGAAAEEVKLPLYGGAGGEHFEYRCRDNGYLVGIQGYVGAWLDNIQAICAKRDADTGHMRSRAPEGPVFGGAEGRVNVSNHPENSRPCVRDQIVKSFDVRETGNQPVLGRIRLACVYSTTGTWSRGVVPNVTELRGSDALRENQLPLFSECPGNLVAIGIRGRSGLYLDAFGLICGEWGRASTRTAPVTVASVAADGSRATYQYPTVRMRNGELMLLDWCRDPGTNCGRPAAEAFCRANGYAFAESFEEGSNVGRTGILGNGSICTQAECDGFDSIVCNKSNVLRAEASDGPSPFAADPVDPAAAAVRDSSMRLSERSPNCIQGFVWRVAAPHDLVCVTPQSRQRVAAENRSAADRRDPKGAYGPFTCTPGYVWRNAFPNDLVCVPPDVRRAVSEENRLGPGRRAAP